MFNILSKTFTAISGHIWSHLVTTVALIDDVDLLFMNNSKRRIWSQLVTYWSRKKHSCIQNHEDLELLAEKVDKAANLSFPGCTLCKRKCAKSL